MRKDNVDYVVCLEHPSLEYSKMANRVRFISVTTSTNTDPMQLRSSEFIALGMRSSLCMIIGHVWARYIKLFPFDENC